MNKYKIKRYFLRFLGKNVYPTLEELRNSGMKIGNNVDIVKSYIDPLFPEMISIGNNVTITNSTLLAHDASLRKIIGFSKFSPIKIGDNVFIGYGSIILPGVTIGNNVIVGAGSVVTKNIPDDYVVAGTPPNFICTFQEYIKKIKKTNILEKPIEQFPWNLSIEERRSIMLLFNELKSKKFLFLK